MSLGEGTRLLGVIGGPDLRSLSPAMQGAALAALGLDLAYGAFAVPPERLAAAVAGAAALGFVGLNVTMPHKEAALALCRPDEQAVRVGAVNTLCFGDGGMPRGLNTDVHGFRMLLAEVGASARGARVALLGAGGAARAVALALVDDGAEVIVVSRSRSLALAGRVLPQVAFHDQALRALLPTVDLLVDATPRGLDDAAPRIDLAPLPDHAAVVDLVVRRSTPLVDDARARGLRAAPGTAMLLHQGAQALEAWIGRAAPVAVMRAALDAALAATASCSR